MPSNETMKHALVCSTTLIKIIKRTGNDLNCYSKQQINRKKKQIIFFLLFYFSIYQPNSRKKNFVMFSSYNFPYKNHHSILLLIKY